MSTPTIPSRTRQPMCAGGKIQLPAINGRETTSVSKDATGLIKNESNQKQFSINGNILRNDLCYNRCPNGEAPQIDETHGQYFCLVPALVTYSIIQGDSLQKTQDKIDFATPYTVSCQSTDLLDMSTQQSGNTGNVMFGTPVLIKSGLYESPVSPYSVRASDFTPSGDNKWFCKRPMYGAPPLGALQSPYEVITDAISEASNDISNCKTSIDNATVSSGPSASNQKSNCNKIGVMAEAALAISGGLPISMNTNNEMTVPEGTSQSLNLVATPNNNGIAIVGTNSFTDPNSGATSMPAGIGGGVGGSGTLARGAGAAAAAAGGTALGTGTSR